MESIIRLPKPLILASNSPRRAQLLKQVGLEFRVIVSNVQEVNHSDNPEDHVLQLSLAKARKVANHIDNGLVVGADTIVVLNKKILGKPADQKEAFSMLRFLSGQTHQVFTGFAVVDCPSQRFLNEVESTRVTFRHLSDEEIRRYIQLDHPYDKAGSYGIQDRSAVFVEHIEGDYNNVVGFPLTKFYLSMKRFLPIIKTAR
jgi:septum formation protein